MKKIKLDSSRLQLSKEKIASLSKQDLHKLRGGTYTETNYDCTADGCETENEAMCPTGAMVCPPETNWECPWTTTTDLPTVYPADLC